MFSIHNIKEYQDSYSLEQVNCLEKPMLMLLQNYDEIYYHLVLMFHKLVQSYETKLFQDDIVDCRTLHRLQRILQEEFSVDLCCELNFNNMCDFIKKQLDANNPVILPVDLYELYYSVHYKKTHWVHAFLIYGYNPEKHLFYTIDDIQNSENNYQKFCISEQMLQTLFNSLNSNVYREGIYYIKTKSVTTELSNEDIKKHIVNCINLFRNGSTSAKCRALKCLDSKMSKTTNPDEISQYLFERIKFKEVFFLELKFLLNLFVANDSISNLIRVQTEIINEWKKDINRMVYYIYKRQPDKIQSFVSNIIELENRMFDCLESLDLAIYNERETCTYSFINNDDSIISQHNKNIFEFNFYKTNKIYDNWIDDCSPRVLLNHYIIDSNRTTSAKTTIDVSTRNMEANYLAGFFIKTKSNNRYNVGVKNGLSLSMDHAGHNPCMFIVDKCAAILDLSLRFQKNSLLIMCENSETSEHLLSKEVLLDDEICEIGLSCKTWGYFYPIQISFSGFTIE